MAKKNFKGIDKIRDQMHKADAPNKANIEILDAEINSLGKIFDLRQKAVLTQQKLIEQQKLLNNYVQLEVETAQDGQHINKRNLKIIKQEKDERKKLVDQVKLSTKNLEKKLATQEAFIATIKASATVFKSATSSVAKYLMESDSAMKGLSLELGLSGERSERMRENLMESAGYAARMGIDMKGLTQMVSTYADETGRVRNFNEENLNALTLMAKGTSLGVEGAARMAGQFEMMGLNAEGSATEVSRIVDTTERMGVNTGKVLKAVNTNFKKLQKFSFRNGVSSMADMAIYAEKFKINMDSVLAPLESGRHLDSVIKMSAELQVLGGNFANLADPMSMLFESRNDPEAYMKRINSMTKGMVTLNKTAKGFEFEMASPMAQDMLAKAAKALGMTTDELTQQAFRMREIQQTRSQMAGKGLSKGDKELIEGLAKFNSKTGRMMVEIGGVATDVSKLGSNQMEALRTQKTSLEERALASQTFDEAFKNTIQELKATLLPLLKGINSVLTWLRPIVTNFTEWFSGLGGVSQTLLAAGGLLLMAATTFAKNKIGSAISGRLGGGAGGMSMFGGASGKGVKGIGKGMGAAGKGAGMRSMGAGAGVGMAALGAGAGIGLAAVGISSLADSMAKLTPQQAESLESIVSSIAWMSGIAVVAAAAIGIFGVASSAASLGLLAFGGAVLMVGAGIGIAAAGIGYMGEGLAKLDGVNLDGVGLGMMGIGAAALMMGNPIGLIGVAAMTASVIAIGANASNLERVGNAFANISAVMKGSSSDLENVKNTINSISSADMGSTGIAELASILSKPIQVKFADQEVAIRTNIDLNMDSSVIVSKVVEQMGQVYADKQGGKG